jgi:hypothetical protein
MSNGTEDQNGRGCISESSALTVPLVATAPSVSTVTAPAAPAHQTSLGFFGSETDGGSDPYFIAAKISYEHTQNLHQESMAKHKTDLKKEENISKMLEHNSKMLEMLNNNNNNNNNSGGDGGSGGGSYYDNSSPGLKAEMKELRSLLTETVAIMSLLTENVAIMNAHLKKYGTKHDTK